MLYYTIRAEIALEPERGPEVEKYLTVEQIAENLSVGAETVRRWLRTDDLEAVKAGRGWRITEEAVDRFLGRQTEEQAAEGLREGKSQ